MSKIHVPAHLIAQFKNFCKHFSHTLEAETGTRLRGNKLLNTMAKAAGHDHYKALLIDSGVYGNGGFNWESLAVKLCKPLEHLLELPEQRLLNPLNDALIKTIESIDNPKEVISSKESHEYIFNSQIADISLKDIPNPIINLSHLNGINNETDQLNLLRVILAQYKALSEEQQMNTVFLGEEHQIKQLLLSSSDTANTLLRNPSIQAYGLETIFMSTNLSDLENTNTEATNVLMDNAIPFFFHDELPTLWANKELTHTLNMARSQSVQNKEYFSPGERFAGRQQPSELKRCTMELKGYIEAVKSEINPTMSNSYDLQSFSNCLYGKLTNTSGFSSLDLAGWLLDNSRRLGVSLFYR